MMTSIFLFVGVLLFIYGVGNIAFLRKEFIERDRTKRRQLLPVINIAKEVWSSKENFHEQAIYSRSVYSISMGTFLISIALYLDKGWESPAIIFTVIGLLHVCDLEWRRYRFISRENN